MLFRSRYALAKLAQVPGVRVYGKLDAANLDDRLGVIAFNVEGLPHALVAAILSYEGAIGVRSGCFCAHPYILHLLGLTPDEAHQVRERMLAKDKSDMPGLIRASFGLYNSFEDVDGFVEALAKIAHGEYKGVYTQDITTGEYHAAGWQPDFDGYFSIQTA